MKSILFWQPQRDYFKAISSTPIGHFFIVSSNYAIWVFLFYVSYLLIRSDINFFWRLLFATVISETIEKYLKIKNLWARPFHHRQNQVPNGLLKNWYTNGSFPSGHAMKAMFFFLFVLGAGMSLSPLSYLLVVGLLLIFRVITGFHYPVDIFGGAVFGVVIWFLTSGIVMPPALNAIIQSVFNTVFFIR
ncbi:MAG TPA: phosphatase PAP2 family protein [Patescibacteria group bacterium]|nr:phosphatase PAP2 family protein [Patescibacteria group bacterium]